jgi:hypothetical protein
MQIVREYTYAFGAVSPKDGNLDSLVLPVVTAEAMSIFLEKRGAEGGAPFFFSDRWLI